ncbi:MAG: hypothetical protein K8R37_10165 [Bacteroidales bacterium]|nr:hypothetical protein [Bacteroidales bacterium]
MKMYLNKFLPGILFVCFLSFTELSGQNFRELYTIIDYPVIPEIYSNLPEKVNETSGLIYYSGSLWTFNDSGGKPELYKINKESGKIDQKVFLKNAENYDWEDITQDDEYIYIGDFGNNRGNRKDLKIYKIAKKDISAKKKVEVEAEVIEFVYNDQTSFEIENRKNNFDCESLISYGDSLIIFSKNWVNGKTRMYKLPKVPGKYKLDPVDSFDVDGLVTGADYNAKTKELILVGYKDYLPFMFLFQGFKGQSLNTGQVYRINFRRMKNAQTEGIIWLNDETIVFSAEQTSEFPQAAYEFKIREVFKLIEK